MKTILRAGVAAVVALAAILAVTCPAIARPAPTGHPFLYDSVPLVDGTGSAAVRAAAGRWDAAPNLDTYWTDDDLAKYVGVILLWDVDGDRVAAGADATARPVLREYDPGMENCAVWIRKGIAGDRLAHAVAAATGRCLGLTGKPHGRSVFRKATLPTARDLAAMGALYATNPVEPQ